MPRAMKHCGINGCTVLVKPGTRCDEHKARWPTDNRTQRTTNSRHKAWQTAVLRNAHGQCQIRYAGICTGRAEHADHILAVGLGGAEYDPANGQGACEPCHKAKSSDEGHIAQGHQVPPRKRL